MHSRVTTKLAPIERHTLPIMTQLYQRALELPPCYIDNDGPNNEPIVICQPSPPPSDGPTIAPISALTEAPTRTPVVVHMPTRSPTASPHVHHVESHSPTIRNDSGDSDDENEFHVESCVDDEGQDVDEMQLNFEYQMDVKRGFSHDHLLLDVENAIVDGISSLVLDGCASRRLSDVAAGKMVGLSAAPEDLLILTTCTPSSDETDCQTIAGYMTLTLERGSSKDIARDQTLKVIRDAMNGNSILSKLDDSYQGNVVGLKYMSPQINDGKVPSPSPTYNKGSRNVVDPTASNNNSSELNNLFLAGAAAGGVLLIALLVFVGVMAKRKRRSTKVEHLAEDYPMDDYSDDSETYLSATPSPRGKPQEKLDHYYNDSDDMMVHRGTASLAAPFDLPSWFHHTAFDDASETDCALDQQSVASSAWDMESIHSPSHADVKFTTADFNDGDDPAMDDPKLPLQVYKNKSEIV